MIALLKHYLRPSPSQIYLLRKGFEILRNVSNTKSMCFVGSFSPTLTDEMYFPQIKAFYDDCPVGSEIWYTDGERAGFNRGLLIIAMHRAYSLPVAQGNCTVRKGEVT